MSTNLAAMYNQSAAAEQARMELLASGLQEDAVDLIRSENDLRGRSGGAEGYFRSLFDEERQHDYIECFTEGVRRGATIVSVREADEQAAGRIREILNRHSPLDLDTCHREWGLRGQQAASAGQTAGARRAADTARTDSASRTERTEQRIPVIEEQLEVGKQKVQDDGMRVVSRVRSQPVEETVHLREERPTIERRRVDRPATEADLRAAGEDSIEVRGTHEEPVVRKSARVKEEVVVGKEVRDRTEKVRGDVKRTEVEVRKGDKDIDGGGTSHRP